MKEIDEIKIKHNGITYFGRAEFSLQYSGDAVTRANAEKWGHLRSFDMEIDPDSIEITEVIIIDSNNNEVELDTVDNEIVEKMERWVLDNYEYRG